jgi:hypothetical protein
MRVVLEHSRRRLDRVDRASAGREDFRPGLERQVQPGPRRLVLLIGKRAALDHPRAAVYDELPVLAWVHEKAPVMIGTTLRRLRVSAAR